MNFDDDGPPLLVDTKDLTSESRSIDFPSPVTIVTGYLGSGKSTLLKHITSNNGGKRIAIVLNEFGHTSDIERSIAVRNRNADGVEVEQWVELDNGCMCCTAKDAGVAAIEKLMERQGRFDNIIIETSGVADPAPIAKMFWLDDALMARVKLDGVVTVVDCQTILRSLSDGPLASLQIACSDVVLINKCDTVSHEQVSEVAKRIQLINGTVPIIQCNYGEVDTSKILDLDAYSAAGVTFNDLHSSAVDSQYSHQSHGLSTVLIKIEPSLLVTSGDLAALEAKLQVLLWSKEVNGHPIEIHRTKGKLQCGQNTECPSTKIVQGVREVYEIVDVEYEPSAESKLVLIGRGLTEVRDHLTDMFSIPKDKITSA